MEAFRPHAYQMRREKRSKLGRANPIAATGLFTLQASSNAPSNKHQNGTWLHLFASRRALLPSVHGPQRLELMSFDLETDLYGCFWFLCLSGVHSRNVRTHGFEWSCTGVLRDMTHELCALGVTTDGRGNLLVCDARNACIHMLAAGLSRLRPCRVENLPLLEWHSMILCQHSVVIVCPLNNRGSASFMCLLVSVETVPRR